MGSDEFEIVIGKLIIAKQFMTHAYYESIDAIVEDLVQDYLELRNNNEL